MNKNTKKTNLTSNNSTFTRSVSKETKSHFDSLLKKALNQNDKSQKEVNNQNRATKVIQKVKSLSKDIDSNIIENTNDTTLVEENFILEKFLSDAVKSKKSSKVLLNDIPESSKQLINSVTFIKSSTNNKEVNSRPVSREGTYSVKSHLSNNNELDKIEKLSTCSKNTYDVFETKVINSKSNQKDDDKASNSSERTYDLDKPYNETLKKQNTAPLGVIEIYNSSKSKSLVKVINKNKQIESDSSAQIQSESESINQKTEEVKILQVNDSKIEQDSDFDIQSASCEDVLKESGRIATREKKIKRKKFQKLALNDSSCRLKENIYAYDDYIGIVVYKSDKLMLNSFIHHPCVKIHIVDIATGEYLAKSNVDFGSPQARYNYPKITKSYELQQNKSLIPYWEELIVFYEDFEYFLDYKDSIIIFFELLDFSSFSEASARYIKEGSNSGWHKIAWAFLKLYSKTGSLNIEEKIRLQLYKPKKYVSKKLSSECILYDWWSNGNNIKYPSTLHVSIKRIKAIKLKKTNHSDAVFKSELCLNLIEKDAENNECSEEINNDNGCIQPVVWSRTARQTCKIPNKVQNQLRSSKKGCFAIKFSNNGLLLACGVSDEVKCPIIVYSALNKNEEYCKFAGHQGIIYNLHWTDDDKYLISSSADCTVNIWNVLKKQYYYKQVLPHPSFVYSAILNENNTQIITACYDQVMRVWQASTIESNYDLQQELEGHLGYLTTLCFGKEKSILYSGDNCGVIIEWIFNQKEWVLFRTFKFKELERTIINNIVLHPGLNRLIVFCRDNAHRMIDISVGCIIQWYRGILNYRVHTMGTISPCGNLVFASSENGSIFVWNTDTGVLSTTYNPYSNYSKSLIVPHCLHYHPFDNIIAISHYGSNTPVLFYVYDNNVTENDLLKNISCDNEVQENVKEKKSNIPKPTSRAKQSVKLQSTASFNQIIDKIDDVIVSAKSDQHK